MDAPKTFVHEAFIDEAKQIRLMTRSKDGGYSLETFNFDSCPPYTALSYTWGPALPTKTIIVNGCAFTIRENLWHFLEQLKYGITIIGKVNHPLEHPHYMWIDQICIDQSSKVEKSHQVQRMAQIFSTAENVIAWIGPGDDDSDTAMHLFADSWPMERTSFDSDEQWAQLNYHHQSYRRRLLDDRRSIGQFLSRPYWRRLWIVQEVVLAQKLMIACGQYSVSLRALEIVDTIYSHSTEWSDTDETTDGLSIFPLFNAKALEDAYQRSASMDASQRPLSAFAQVLSAFYMHQCEDPRDRIYGLLALHGGQHIIDVEYTKTAQEVFDELCAVLSDLIKQKNPRWLGRLAEVMGVRYQVCGDMGVSVASLHSFLSDHRTVPEGWRDDAVMAIKDPAKTAPEICASIQNSQRRSLWKELTLGWKLLISRNPQ